MVTVTKKPISTSFATGVELRYRYLEQDIALTITDLEVVEALSKLTNGKTYRDNPSCGFSKDVSITFFNEKKVVIICPALDGDPILRVGDSGNNYIVITDKARAELDDLLQLYGFAFPAV